MHAFHSENSSPQTCHSHRNGRCLNLCIRCVAAAWATCRERSKLQDSKSKREEDHLCPALHCPISSRHGTVASQMADLGAPEACLGRSASRRLGAAAAALLLLLCGSLAVARKVVRPAAVVTLDRLAAAAGAGAGDVAGAVRLAMSDAAAVVADDAASAVTSARGSSSSGSLGWGALGLGRWACQVGAVAADVALLTAAVALLALRGAWGLALLALVAATTAVEAEPFRTAACLSEMAQLAADVAALRTSHSRFLMMSLGDGALVAVNQPRCPAYKLGDH